MTVSSISLNISTPTEPITSGRGFYQLEEEALFVQVGLFTNSRRFYSYLESAGVTFDFDRQGRLIFLEVDIPRKQWIEVPGLKAPTIIEPADIRWLNFRDNIIAPVLLTNERRNLLKLSFLEPARSLSFYVADTVIVQTDLTHRLAALWVADIRDDMAGKRIRTFRKNSRAKQSYYA